MNPAIRLESPRPLLVVDPLQLPVYRFDLVVLGSGVAGASTALAAAEAGASVAVLAKGEVDETNTRWAQGGLAVVLSRSDTFASHVEDTMRVGCGLSEQRIVERVVSGGPAAIERLLELGMRLDRDPQGHLAASREGGHSHPRVVHANGDATGRELQHTLSEATRRHPRIRRFPHTFAIELLADREGCVRGVLTRTGRGEIVAFAAHEIVLATGGSGHVYRETTNPALATGDGIGLAVRAGAVVRDLEFIQFHPTCLYIAGAARVLISEIVRGAGGVLRDRHGTRFMPAAHPAAELAPRDIVSRAVFRRMVETDDTNVYLDLTGIEADPHVAFPGISRICRAFGIDIARDPIPVRPGAHYQVGGVRVDAQGRTSVPGLRAVGEVASSGLHGANRMGSNSLLEGLVLGQATGADAGRRALEAGPVEPFRAFETLSGDPAIEREPPDVELNLEDLTYSLKAIMWRHMGVQRAETGLAEVDQKLGFWMRILAQHTPAEPRAWELVNMLTLARLATFAARARTESRGVHFRTDHPEPDETWRAHSLLVPRLTEGAIEVQLEREPVQGEVPATT